MYTKYRFNGDEKIERFLVWLDSRVTFWSKYAYNIGNLNTGNSKLKLWVQAASDYLDGKGVGDFIYTRYGYAVEELTNIDLLSYTYNLDPDYRVELQVTAGSTRPDIVVYKNDINCAWIDITSKKSEGHIMKKAGDGWKSMPVVAEVMYPELDVTSITATGSDTVAGRSAAWRVMRRKSEKENEIFNYMVGNVDRSMMYITDKARYSALTAKDVADILENYFKIPFQPNYKHPIVKSILQMYVDRPNAACEHFVRETVLPMYKDAGQNKAQALDYIHRCYENSKIYTYY